MSDKQIDKAKKAAVQVKEVDGPIQIDKPSQINPEELARKQAERDKKLQEQFKAKPDERLKRGAAEGKIDVSAKELLQRADEKDIEKDSLISVSQESSEQADTRYKGETKLSKEKERELKKKAQEKEKKESEVYKVIETDENPIDVGELVEDIVRKAMELESSDVHIEQTKEDIIVRYRVDGLLREVLDIDKKLARGLLFKVKVLAKLRTDEHFAPQDGRIGFEFEDGSAVDTRVSILPTAYGEKVVMRLLSADGKNINLDTLGLRKEEMEKVQKAFRRPYGTILAVGPTGSGKTTTLYSILKILNEKDVNITTIEDPVEYTLVGVNHVQINPKANLTFANGLRSIVRQDPDIIMVGEIRDGETAGIATNAAMTGHLVLSTIHTNDSVTTIPRLIDMDVEPFLVSATLNVIIAQRLVRKLCDRCKEKVVFSEEDHALLEKSRKDITTLIPAGTELYEARGCDECTDTGYKGRVGLYEVLEVNEEMRRLISKKAGYEEIFEQARKNGLRLIVEAGVEKTVNGETTIEELVRVTAQKD